MTDKEKIIAEIERRIHFLDGMINTDFGRGSLDALNKVLDFINSLPAEQPNEDLEEEIKRKYEGDNALMMPIKDFRELILHFTDWQKKQIMKNCLYDTEVILHTKQNNTEYLTLANDKLPHIPISFGINVGDKVKVIIVKEDEQ